MVPVLFLGQMEAVQHSKARRVTSLAWVVML
jgi:hypothetical protein